MKLKQNGNTMDLSYGRTGQIEGKVLVYQYTEKNGKKRKNEYRLIGNGNEIELRMELGDEIISNRLSLKNNFTAPKQDEIDNYRQKHGGFETSLWSYAGYTAATMYDNSDRDQIADEYDKCSHTTAGLTLENGGVNITGCPADGQ